MEEKDLKEKLIDEFNESGESNFADFIKQKEEEAINNGDIELSEFYHRILSGQIVEDEILIGYAEHVQEELNYKNYLESEYKKYYIAYSDQEEHYKSFEHYIESKVAALSYEDFESDSELEKELWDILKLHKEKETQMVQETLKDKKVNGTETIKNMSEPEEELDYIESAYSNYHSEFLSSDYESFEEYIWAKIHDLESWETSRKDELFEVLDLYKKQAVQTEKKVEDSVSLEDMTIEELIEAATRNQGTINENEQVIKDALIKRILEQQQKIGEQEEEIKRLRGQKVI